MTVIQAPKDLVLLVADKNMEFAIKGLLTRPTALDIRDLAYRIDVHPERDPGCRLRGDDYLRIYHKQFAHGVIILDHEGCGGEKRARERIESEIEQRLSASGWGSRAAAIVIEPELEAWVWSKSPHVERIMGWEGKNPNLRNWLQQEGLLQTGEIKPKNPKEAMELALRAARVPRSSSHYLRLAQEVSFERCTEQAFKKLRTLLRNWFPIA